jgi:hypothetical protein
VNENGRGNDRGESDFEIVNENGRGNDRGEIGDEIVNVNACVLYTRTFDDLLYSDEQLERVLKIK